MEFSRGVDLFRHQEPEFVRPGPPWLLLVAAGTCTGDLRFQTVPLLVGMLPGMIMTCGFMRQIGLPAATGVFILLLNRTAAGAAVPGAFAGDGMQYLRRMD